jgi:flagellar P-ring protein precursor FlgI
MVSQPDGTAYFGVNEGGRTIVRPESNVDVEEQGLQAVRLDQGATIGELVTALRAIRVTTRDVIAILQGIKGAGALHAELIIQ